MPQRRTRSRPRPQTNIWSIGSPVGTAQREGRDSESHRYCCCQGREKQREDNDEEAADQRHFYSSVIAIARSAMRSRADSFSVALLSWPQAARMSRPRGVRTGEA